MTQELWIYGIKDNEIELLNAIQDVTSSYYTMPSAVYGALEYRVFISDNSELLTLINSINKIVGVMFTPERFQGMGLALNPDGTPWGTKVNPDGTPWSEIGYMTNHENPANVTLGSVGTYSILLEIDYQHVTWANSSFEISLAASPLNTIWVRTTIDDESATYYSLQDLRDDFGDIDSYIVYDGGGSFIVNIIKEKRNTYLKIECGRGSGSNAGAYVHRQVYKWRKL